MSSFSLHIATDNAAFERNPKKEVARIMADVASAMRAGQTGEDGTVRDINGNTCGRWFWTDRYATHDDGAALELIAHTIEHRDDLERGESFLVAIAETVRLTGRTIAPDDDEDERDEYEPRGDYGPEEIDAQHIRDAGRGHLI